MASRFLSPIDGRSQSQSGSLPNQRYLWVISALLGIGVLSPLSGTLFTFSFGYSVEVPILLTMLIGLLASFKLNVALSRAILIGVVGGALALLPFVVFAIINGTPFASYYPDFRAILLLIVTYVGLSALNEGTALELIYKTCVLAVLTTGVLFLLQHSGLVTGVVSHNFTGQYFPPVYPVIIAVIFMSHRKSFAFPILAILLLLLMTVTASYRQLYLISALLVLSGMHVVFYGLVGRLASLAFATAFFILVIGSIVTVNIYPNHVYDVLHRNAGDLVSMGIDPSLVYQLLIKTAGTLTGQTTVGGDGVYVMFTQNQFNVPHFALPHGLGQSASIGDPHIWFGNTVDNSLIFFNYHFSVFVTLPLLFCFILWLKKSCSNASLPVMLSLLPALAAVVVFLYFRALPFVASDAAMAFAMLLFAAPALARQHRKNPDVQLKFERRQSKVPCPAVSDLVLRDRS